jgi:hypothetical protein
MISLPQDLEEKLSIVARAERRPLASMCLALIEVALKLPRFKELLNEKEEAIEDVVSNLQLDKISPSRIQELKTILAVLEKIQADKS